MKHVRRHFQSLMLASKPFILIVLICLSGCGDSLEKQSEHMASAQKFFEQGLYDKARIEAQNVLQLNEKHLEARFLRAEVAEKQQNWRQAFADLNFIVEEQPTHLEAQVKLGQIFLLSGDLEKAVEKVDLVLAADPEHIDALLLQAVVLLKDKKVTEAEALVSGVLEKHPAHANASSLMTRIMLTQGQDQAALALLNTAIVAHPQDMGLRLLKINLHQKLQQPTEVEAEFKTLLEMNPDNEQLYYSLAKFYLSNNNNQQARETLEQAIAKFSGKIEPKLTLVQLIAKIDGLEAADKRLQSFVEQDPKQYKLRFALGELRAGSTEQVKAVYQEIVALDGESIDGLEARVRLARIAIGAKDQPEAIRLISEVLAVDEKNSQALLLRAGLSLQDKDIENAIADLRSVLGNEPDSEPALRLLGAAHLANGDTLLAKENLQNALKVEPTSIKSRAMLAQLFLKTNEVDSAQQLLEEGVKQAPGDVNLLGMLTELHIKQKQWEPAAKTARALMTQGGEAAKGRYLLGVIYQQQKRFVEAVVEYRQAHQIQPGNPMIMRRLTESLIAQDKPEAAISALQKRLAENPKEAASLDLLGDIFAWQKKTPEAEQYFMQAVQAEPRLVSVYRKLAKLYYSAQQQDQTLAIIQQGLGEMPDQPLLLMDLAEFYQKNNQNGAAISTYQQLLKKSPDNMFALNNYAALIADESQDSVQLEQALVLVDRFKATQQPAFLDTFGWLNYRLKHYAESVSALEKAVELAPKFPVFHYHLAESYYAMQRNDDALKQLELALPEGVKYPGSERAKLLQKELSQPL